MSVTIFVMPRLDGVTISDLSDLTLFDQSYVNKEDVATYKAYMAAVLEDMREAGAHGDLERVDYLDGIYQELLAWMEAVEEAWPDDYLPSELDEPSVW